MNVLILEDDYLQAEWIEQVICDNFKNLRTERISTESDFRSQLDRLGVSPPNLILLDVMVRWTDPDSNIEMPQEIAEEGFYRAGLRCERLLRSNEGTQYIPVILYTVLEAADFDIDLKSLHPRTRYIEKNSDPRELLEIIESILGSTAS